MASGAGRMVPRKVHGSMPLAPCEGNDEPHVARGHDLQGPWRDRVRPSRPNGPFIPFRHSIPPDLIARYPDAFFAYRVP